MAYTYNPHDFSKTSSIGEHICDIVRRYPDKTLINGAVNALQGRMVGALYHEKEQMYFLHNDPTYLHGACPPNGVPPPFRFSYFLGCSLHRDINTFDPHSFAISGVNGSHSSSSYHIRDFTPQIPTGYLMRGTLRIDIQGSSIAGFLYKTTCPGSKTDGDFYFLHDDNRYCGDKPTEGIPSGVTAYSWSLGERIKWQCCDPNSFVPTTGMVEHPTTIVMGNYGDHSEMRRREERARQMDRERMEYERARMMKHTSGGAVFADMSDKTVAVEPPVKEVEKEEPVLFRKHITKKKSCDVLPMQAAVIIKTSKTNK